MESRIYWKDNIEKGGAGGRKQMMGEEGKAGSRLERWSKRNSRRRWTHKRKWFTERKSDPWGVQVSPSQPSPGRSQLVTRGKVPAVSNNKLKFTITMRLHSSFYLSLLQIIRNE